MEDYFEDFEGKDAELCQPERGMCGCMLSMSCYWVVVCQPSLCDMIAGFECRLRQRVDCCHESGAVWLVWQVFVSSTDVTPIRIAAILF